MSSWTCSAPSITRSGVRPRSDWRTTADPAADIRSGEIVSRNGTARVDSWPATPIVKVAGHESTLVVPFTLESSAERIAAAGSVVLRQSDLGLTPFSVMLGALQVQNDITVRFRFVATPPP